ncbi:hypothetical protein BTHERMOSOX_1459 [Bathymodiolus thermophilus thioautotrophic gill symbiont]|nr:hypothetical protein BTHERMOSOX_1459 [Bathymodiolus thermophilus thioautotrophic gill symbiont]
MYALPFFVFICFYAFKRMGYKPIPTHGMVCIIWECGSFLISRFVFFLQKKV